MIESIENGIQLVTTAVSTALSVCRAVRSGKRVWLLLALSSGVYFLGGNDGLLYALLVFVIVDYITGVMCAIEDRKLSSAVGFRGLCWKVLTFLLVGIAQVLNVHVLNQPGVLRTAVIFWAIANNGLSILENAAHLGLPVPEQLKAVLEQLHDRAGKSGEPETVIGEDVE